MIPNFKSRRTIFSELKLCPVDQSRIEQILVEKSVNLNAALQANDIKKVDALLLSRKSEISFDDFSYAALNNSFDIFKLFVEELAPIEKYQELTASLSIKSVPEREEKAELLESYKLLVKENGAIN